MVSEAGQVATYQQQISILTSGHGEMHDLTEQVLGVVVASAIQTGMVRQRKEIMVAIRDHGIAWGLMT
jgi:thiamine phosphate synthase YjbQ (UPF0047 family)